jgi:hypothetical protein
MFSDSSDDNDDKASILDGDKAFEYDLIKPNLLENNTL